MAVQQLVRVDGGIDSVAAAPTVPVVKLQEQGLRPLGPTTDDLIRVALVAAGLGFKPTHVILRHMSGATDDPREEELSEILVRFLQAGDGSAALHLLDQWKDYLVLALVLQDRQAGGRTVYVYRSGLLDFRGQPETDLRGLDRLLKAVREVIRFA